MKGHMEKDGFHPHTEYKGVRKSRDQQAKTQGVRLRKTSSIKAGEKCFCGRTSIKGGLCPSCRDSGVFFEQQQIKQAQKNPKNIGAMQSKTGIRKKSAIAEEDNFDLAVDKLKKSLLQGLNENQWSSDLQRLKNVTWDVDVTYTGSHGTSDSEYFTITAFYKGVGSVEYQEAFSNDDWFDTSDKKLTKRIETDSDFAEREYNKWLISLLDIYEDAMFEGLVATIEETYRE